MRTPGAGFWSLNAPVLQGIIDEPLMRLALVGVFCALLAFGCLCARLQQR
jgi:hypothetical protein